MDIAYLNSASVLVAPHPNAILFHPKAFHSQQLLRKAIRRCEIIRSREWVDKFYSTSDSWEQLSSLFISGSKCIP